MTQQQHHTAPITLYTYTMSPYAEKVHCYLLYKKLDFHCFYVNPLRVKKELPIGKQIPVLSVGPDSKADSTPIGLWLDELFPDKPLLLPTDESRRQKLLDIDNWVSHRLIPSNFRLFPGTGITLRRALNGWRLGQVLHKTSHGGMPKILQASWPLILSQLGFLKHAVAMADPDIPVQEARVKIYQEFLSKLEGGPFLGGENSPTMPDLGAYPQFVAPFEAGLRGAEDILNYPEIMAWIHRMQPYLSGTPALIPPIALKYQMPTHV